jgi:DNA-binding CsgD family transcriptional regulator
VDNGTARRRWERTGDPINRPPDHLVAVQNFASDYRLSGRETDLLRQAAEGRSMKETAFACGISLKTVENYWRRIYVKTGKDAQLAVVAMLFRWSCNHDDPIVGRGGNCPARQNGEVAATGSGDTFRLDEAIFTRRSP